MGKPTSSQPQQQVSHPPTDAELWTALQQGQIDALGQLYDRHAGLVYGIALKLLKHPHDAEDLTQDIFLRLIHSSYDPQRGSLRTFLAILARSRSLDRLRSQQRSQRRLEHWQAQQDPHHIDAPAPEPDRPPDLTAALAQLSENQRQVLHLSYDQGLSQSAIAQQLNVPLGTVKAWARRGLLSLRRHIQRGSEED